MYWTCGNIIIKAFPPRQGRKYIQYVLGLLEKRVAELYPPQGGGLKGIILPCLALLF